jgi:peroxiredoxin Q/BCP
MIEAYGARRMKSFLGKSFLGIVRSSVLISPDGEIEMVWPNAKSKGHASETLAAVEAGNLQSK